MRKSQKYYCQVLLSLIFFNLISSNENLNAQYYEAQITKIIDEKGFSPAATFAIAEDSQGFLWFGTIDGLYRYDGYNFKIFRNDPSNTNSLANNTIRALAIDKNDVLWIATQGGGLDRFDIKTEFFTHFIHTGNGENELNGNSVWSVIIDKKGNIWAGIAGMGVDKIDSKTKQITHYYPFGNKNLNKEQAARCLHEDNQGNIWTGFNYGGYAVINPETGKIKEQTLFDNSNTISNSIYDIFTDSDDKVWILTYGGGIKVIDTKNNTTSTIAKTIANNNSLISDLTYSITERIKNEYWIATEYGISVFNSKSGEYINYRQNDCSKISLSENRVRKIYVDKRGIVWVGTESGVDKFVLQSKFESYKNEYSGENRLNDGIVRAILEDNENNLWIGLIDNGLVKYSKNGKEQKHYLHNPGNSKSLSGNNINTLFQDSNNDIWIGEWNTGLMKYNKKSDSFIFVTSADKKNGLSDTRIQVIKEGRPGILWLGTENGINRFDTKKNTYTLYKHEPGNSNSLSGNSIQSQAFSFDGNGNLWVGTWSNGLNKIEFTDSSQTNANIKHWQNNPGDPKSLSNDNVISLYIDKENIIWIGTFGGGLSRFDPKTEIFTNYTTENGLPNNVIFAIIPDNNNNLWLSTDYGISMFNTSDETFHNYSKSDGLQDNHFFWGAATKGKSGKIYFGGINGLNSFIPENIKPDSNFVQPVLVNINLFNKPIKASKAISRLDEIEFRYDENFISFEFSALDNSDPNNNMYQYMLSGFDKSWIISGTQRNASYTNLSPGKYIFMLKASNSEGVWNNEIVRLKVIVHPPWWKTWLARSFFIISFLSALWFIYKLRISVLQNQKLKLEELVRARTFEIEHKNQLLEEKTVEISLQNEVLNKQKFELSEQFNHLQKTLEKLEKTQKALIEAEKMASIGILTAGVAHEINNPLNFIAVSIEHIKQEISTLEKIECGIEPQLLPDIQSLIAHAETGIERINSITNSLRTYAHRGREKRFKEKISKIITSALTILHSKIPDYITIEHSIDPNLAEIECIQDQITQVLINIIANAIEAIQEKNKTDKEKICIKTSNQTIDEIVYLEIEITNSGPLISDELIKNIFDPFFTTKAPNQGTGLGLYLSYNIIKDHNGLLKVMNEDGMVKFKIYLPY